MRPTRSARFTAAALAAALVLLAPSVPAQEGPVGPCSPYRAVDGDIPSEMPGCARRLRPAPGTLRDEMEFRRARGTGEDAAPDDEDAPRRRVRHPRRD